MPLHSSVADLDVDKTEKFYIVIVADPEIMRILGHVNGEERGRPLHRQTVIRH